MGLFLTILFGIVVLYFVQMGLRRGVFPVLVFFLVSFVAFLIAMSYGLRMAYYLRDGAGMRWVAQDMEVAGYMSLFLISFVVLGFIALKFIPEIAPLYGTLDRMMGFVVGVLAGTLITGALAYGWFTTTIAATRYPVPYTSIYFRPQFHVGSAFNYICARFPGASVSFDWAARRKLLETGSMGRPRTGDYFWVDTIPQGKRVFICTINRLPMFEFKGKLKEWSTRSWSRGPVRDGIERMIEGYVGRSPITVRSDEQGALIAVEEDMPPGTILKDGENPLAPDGNADVYYTGPEKHLFYKIYSLRHKEDVVSAQIALMYAKDAPAEQVEKMLPEKDRYMFKRPEDAVTWLKNDGMSDDQTAHFMGLARRAGRMLYKSADGRTKSFELGADGEFDVKEMGD